MREALEDLLWAYKVAYDSTAPGKYPQSDYLDGYRAFARVAIDQIEEILNDNP